MENRDKIVDILKVVRHTTSDIEKQADRICALFSVSNNDSEVCKHPISKRARDNKYNLICSDCGKML